MGLLTIALTGGDGGAIAASPAVDHVLVARSDDPRIVKEMHVTTYHVLWELVHVFFEQPGVLGPGGDRMTAPDRRPALSPAPRARPRVP